MSRRRAAVPAPNVAQVTSDTLCVAAVRGCRVCMRSRTRCCASSVKGQQFLIEEVKDCNVYLFDDSAAVNIDVAENCRFFIGPCASSLFVRDCKNCDVVAAVQQFRTRDCKNLRVLLFTQTRPIIETSSNVSLGCFTMSYFDLEAQFERAHLSVWNNHWSEVHDFNAGAGSGGHFKLMAPEEEDAKTMLKLSDELAAEVALTDDPVAPRTLSAGRPAPRGEHVLACYMPGVEAQARTLVESMRRVEGSVLVRTRQFALAPPQAKTLFGSNGKLVAAVKGGGEIVAIEFAGAGCRAAVEAAIAAQSMKAEAWFVPADGETAALCQSVFVDWKDEI